MLNYILGIDAGTTAFKIVLFDEYGSIIAEQTEEYSLAAPGPGFVEFPPEEYWNVCKRLIKAILTKANVRNTDIKAIAIDSQGETLICVDKEGRPLGNAIVWLDNRSVEEAGLIEKEFGAQKVYEITGQPEVVPTWPATKILWFKRKKPEIFERTSKFLLLEDFLIYKLTGKFAAEKSLLSSTILLDINRGIWWEDMLDFIGISPDQLPEIMESADAVGSLTAQASMETGLSTETIVVTGALDQAAGMIGAGGINEGVITETTGTCLAVCVNTGGKTAFNKELKVPRHYGVLPESYYSIFWSPTAGIVLKWFKENFLAIPQYSPIKIAEPESVYYLMDCEAKSIPAGSDGLIMLPHLSGTQFPEFNQDARGVYCGFTLAHSRGHFIRAILESVAYLMNQYIRTIENSGIVVNEIRSLGGGSKSRLWNSIKADVTQKSIITLKNSEATCLGAAMLAGIGIGLYKSVEDACDKTVHTGEIFRLDKSNAAVYENGYSSFLKLYDKIFKI